MIQFDLITLFPRELKRVFEFSIIGRAQTRGLIKINFINLRDFGLGHHQQVDDTPYGGGRGMLLRADVVINAIESIKDKTTPAPVILLTPQGDVFNQPMAEELSSNSRLILVAGHYEGFDQRVHDYVDRQISIGNYVLTGGELPAAVVVDAIARLAPGVIKEDSQAQDSFSNQNGQRSLKYPEYTKPEVFRNQSVPSVLLSGHHQAITKWRREHRVPRQNV